MGTHPYGILKNRSPSAIWKLYADSRGLRFSKQLPKEPTYINRTYSWPRKIIQELTCCRVVDGLFRALKGDLGTPKPLNPQPLTLKPYNNSQMEKTMDNEMETGIMYRVYIGFRIWGPGCAASKAWMGSYNDSLTPLRGVI